MRLFWFLAVALLNSGISAAPVAAADLVQPIVPPPLVITNEWKFQATLYGWATALNGKVGVRGLRPVNVNVSFSDILKNLDGAVMGSFYASNGKWMVLTDVIFAKLSDRVDVGPFGGSVKFEQKQAIVQGAVGYALPLGIPNLQLGPTVGVRYNYLDAKIEINPALIPVSAQRQGSKNWADPTIGLSMHYDINDRWFVNALADIGGFGVGSKLTSQGFVSLGYMWTKNVSTAIGYRVIYTDYKDGGFVYDTTQQGLFTSLAFHF
ncbi:hypothetical protein LMIY3S_01546 [Labrys miyagiensis]